MKKERLSKKSISRMLMGFFLMPILPMMLADILFFSRGLDTFNRFQSVPARVISISEEMIEIRTSKYGNQGALYDYRVRPLVTYEYVVGGKKYISNRYFLFEGSTLSDRPENRHKETSISGRILRSVKPGANITVNVASSDPDLSFVNYGWQALFSSFFFWLKTYSAFVLLALVAWGLDSLARFSQKNQPHHEGSI